MKIKREILGQPIEIELTPEEIREAYLIEQHSLDVDDMKDFLEDEGYDTCRISDVYMHGLANYLRKKLNNGENSLTAMEEVKDEHMNVLSYYERKCD